MTNTNTQIKSFGRTEHAIVSRKVLAALQTLESELGVKFAAQGGVVGQSGGHIKLAVEVQDTGNGISGAEAQFQRYAHMYGLKPSHFGKVFHIDGTAYRINGISPSRPKFPIDAERVHDGKPFKHTRQVVATALERAGL